MAHTKDLLADALNEIGLTEMATRAGNGFYHDFLSPLPFPELYLVHELADVGTPEAMALRKRCIEGDFDATTEESEEWAHSEEGRLAFERLARDTEGA